MRDMIEELINTGIDIIGSVPWSTHFCQFYQTKEDLLDIIVPYFKAGLQHDELCVWILSDSISERDAREALEKKIPDIERYFKSGEIQLFPYTDWYLKSGSFCMEEVLDAWIEKLDGALSSGFKGLRVTGDSAWLKKKDWGNFIEYETAVNRAIRGRRMLAICTYCLDKCNALEMLDVLRNHEYSLIRQGNRWELIGNTINQQTKEKLKKSEERFRGIFENSPIGIQILDSEGKLITANKACLDIFGVSGQSKYSDYCLFKDNNISGKLKERLIKGESVGFETPLDFNTLKSSGMYETSKSGISYLDMLVTPLKNEETHEVIGYLEQVQDVTERKKIEEFLAQSKDELELRVKQRTIELEKVNLALNREIEQHRQAREKVFAIANSFRNLVASSADGILIINKDGKVRLVNPAAETLLGCETGGLINSQFEYPLMADGKSEIDIMKSQFEIHTAEMSVVETQWEGEACYLAMLRDITQSKKVREALRQSKSQLEHLINSMSEGVTLIDKQGKVIKANPAMSRITGKKISEIEGNLCTDLGKRVFDSEYHTLAVEELPMSSVLKTRKGNFNFELGLERDDGLVVWLVVNTVPLIDDNGELEGIVRTIHDISEQKRMAESLRKSEAHLRLMLNQIPCMLWTTDRQLIFELSLGAGLKTFNLSPNQLSGMSIFDYYNTSDPDFNPILAHRKALAGEAATYELHWEGKILDCYVEPLKDNNKIIGVIGLSFDITDKKNAEEALRALSRRLVDVQENERRSVARELHDEIGQSLTGLNLMMTQISRTGSDGSLSNILEAQEVVTELIRQVRDISLSLRPSMLDDLGLLPTLLWYIERYTLQTRIKVEFEHWGLQGDFSPEVNTAIYRIIQEALTNVARHANAKEVNITIWSDDNKIVLKLEDHGRGFKPSDLYSSTSTGISGMRERVLSLSGKLDIRTLPGSGTCLEAEIPLK
ncbi:MAG: PAS domain S-box protein [Dehalococcoidales bacterium]|nr:PAS domain S-box protein [Dehalococcoidales bacterium]